jgi:putative Mg2+ transporter-C (MgtC) family protein
MSPEIHWPQIALRLALTLLAGGLLGWERSRTGHFAGLRTTLLVALAASLSMIQVNLLLATNGKSQSSYVELDLMRLPLGILTGVGFIGAGAILRKGEMVLGITTAATLWFATVVGLCLGGGQLALGSASALLGFAVLWGLRGLEGRIERYQLAELSLTLAADRLTPHALRERLEQAKFRIKSISVTRDVTERTNVFACQVRWPATKGGAEVPLVLGDLEQLPGLIRLEWNTSGGHVSN